VGTKFTILLCKEVHCESWHFVICVAKVRQNFRNFKAESRKITQWGVLHFILFIMNFKVQGYSLCGRNYLFLCL